MVWQGKALGALIGGVSAGPVGALFGAFIGHLVDMQADAVRGGGGAFASSAQVQEAFFRATFLVMGHVAKADGRVTQEEIRAARAMMNELRLGEREVQLAIELFTEGKRQDLPLEQVLGDLHRMCRNRPDLRRMFMQIQLQAALWGSGVSSASRQVLNRVAAGLGISSYEVIQMEAVLRMQRSSRESQRERAPADRISEAYTVLGVTRQASDAEVTKAYRRLMNQNHPDKLVARGLPESMIKVAEEKTRQIRAAYEVLREARAMR